MVDKDQTSREEYQIMALLDHKNIVPLIGVIENDERVCIVMEYASGGDLFEYLRRRKSPLDLSQVLSIFKQIVKGMYYHPHPHSAHTLSRWHTSRDLISLSLKRKDEI